MASSMADQVASSNASSQASTSYQSRLPDKKTFIATLSGGAFVVGLTGATIYGLRKAKLQALKEAQELAEASQSANLATATVSAGGARAAVPASLSRSTRQAGLETTREGQGSDADGSTSAMGLFRQMNAAILNPSRRSSIATDAGGTRAPTSVFDDETGALPSVLRRRTPAASASSTSKVAPSSPILASSASSAPSSSASATLSNPTDPKIDYSEMDSTLDFLGLSSPVPPEEQQRMKALDEAASNGDLPRGFFQSPVGLSLKAFFVATSIVTISTLATLELTKWALGVDTMDEFVVAMTKIIPSRARGEGALEGAAPHMRVQRDASDLAGAEAGAAVTPPKSVDQALTDLSNAASFEEWVSTLRNQLDSERDFEVSRRFSHLPSPGRNDSTSSSRGYVAHSVLEKEDGSLFAISPLLPSTAFAMGLVSGMLTSGKRAGLVFMAENAHRLPDTVQGWYFYSKTKNYKVLLGAAKGGLRQGVRLGLWTTGFCFAERAAELTRSAVQEQFGARGAREGEGRKVLGHWTDGAIAGVGTAAIATGLYRLPRASAVRVFQLGLLAGASTGGIRDLQERLVKEDIGGVASHT